MLIEWDQNFDQRLRNKERTVISSSNDDWMSIWLSIHLSEFDKYQFTLDLQNNILKAKIKMCQGFTSHQTDS